MNSENEIAVQFQQGNPAAFKAVRQKLGYHLLYNGFWLCYDRSENERMVEQLFIKIEGMHTQFSTWANIKAFLFITQKNWCYRYLHSRPFLHKCMIWILARLPFAKTQGQLPKEIDSSEVTHN
jgi:hypothetical protein